jgi:hypothetical protein
MTKFTVIGAGMAGLFAAAMLRTDCASVLEAQDTLPNNHAALLRFRSSIVGDTLNIPFKPVQVIKAVANSVNPVADAIAYSLKTNGSARLRSVIGAKGEVETRYIAPPDFIAQLHTRVGSAISFGQKWSPKEQPSDHIISTIPMPVLAGLLGYKIEAEFQAVSGYVCTAKLRDTNVYATMYIPDRNELAYRASITGDTLIVEYAFPHGPKSKMQHLTDYPKNLRDHLHWVLQQFGMDSSFIVGVPEIKRQQYAKILPVDDNARKRFMLWASEHHNIYSFGRFATWRPQLLMDDLVNDLRVIQRLAGGASTYDARRS